MSKASTLPIEIQALGACPLNIDAQDVQESNFENLSPMSTGNYEPFMLDGGSTKSEGTSIFVVEMQPRHIFGGETQNGPWVSLDI